MLNEPEMTVGSGNLARRAIVLLVERMSDSRVRDAVKPYGPTFDTAVGHISTLHAYKKVHDLLFRVERGCYRSLLIDAQDFPNYDRAREKMNAHLNILSIFVADAEGIASAAVESRTQLEMVRDKLREAYDALQEAERLLTSDPCKRALIMLEHLAPEQSNFNVLLNHVARYLEMDKLVAAMQSLRGIISDTAAADRYQLGVEDLAKLEKVLCERIKDHDNWQQLDSFLRTFQANSAELLSKIEVHWRFLSTYVAKACNIVVKVSTGFGEETRSDWVDLFIPDDKTDKAALILRDLKKTVKRRDLTGARRDFETLVQHTGDSLDRVDRNLLGVCERITEIKDPLRTLSENLK